MTQLIDLGKLRFYWAGAYNASTTYEVNDVVKYGGNVYVYISVVSASGNVPTNTSYWALMVQGINFRGEYSVGTAYKIGDGVAHGGVVYIAIADTTGNVPPNVTYWSQFADGIQYEGVYNGSTTYQLGDVVTYGGKAYIAKVDTSGNVPTNTTYWDKFVDGISPEGVYNAGTAYQPGDVVAYGANLYLNKLASTGVVPTNTTNWDIFTSGIQVRGNWATSTQYYVNDVVIRGGNTYIALSAHVSNTFDGDLLTTKWSKFNSGIRYRGEYTAYTAYLESDIVFDGINALVATEDFTSGASTTEDGSSWEVFAAGADYLPGQVGNAGKLLTTDGSDPAWSYEVDKIQVGDGAAAFEAEGALTDVIATFAATSTDFAQLVLVNNGNGTSTSTDFIAYSNNGDNTSGWIDMGITAQSFDDPSFTITGPGDGYIFMSGAAQKTATTASYSITDGVATVVTSANHGFTTGTLVTLTTSVAALDGVKAVTAVPALNSFRVNVVGTNIGSTVITSGTATTVLGDGNLVLATDSTGTNNNIVFAAGGLASDNTQMVIMPDQMVHIEIATASTSPTTGALVVAGGAGFTGAVNINGNLDTNGILYVGDTANSFETSAGLTNAMAVFKYDDDAEESSFAQIAAVNADPTSSTDIIAYMNNGTDSEGWVGMGITGSNFDDTTYGITGPGDGYIFHETKSGPTGPIYTGNLVIATGENGSENKIVFAAGGFASGDTQLEITPGVNVHLEIATPSTSPTTGALTVVGGVGISGDMNILGDVNISGTISFGGGGTTVETENLAVADPFIFIASGNPANLLDFGVLGESNLPTTLDPQASITTKASVDSTNTQTVGITYSLGSEPFKVGDSVVITDVDAAFNGTRTISNVTSNTISWINPSATDISTTPATTTFTKNITTKEVFNAVAIITTSSAHGYSVGETVTVANVDSTFNGTYVITQTDSTTFRYAKAVADVPSAPATTTFVTAIDNKELTGGTATLRTTTTHGYSNGETVIVTGVNATFNGTHTITGVTSTSFSYALVGGDVSSSAVSPTGTATVSRLLGTSVVGRLLGAANSTDVLRPRYSGIAKDATDGVWKLFSGATTKPSTIVNFSEDGVVYDPMRVAALTATTVSATTSITTPSVTISGTPTNATDAATVAYVQAAAGGSWSAITTATTATAGSKYFANTAAGSFILTLPASPTVNNSIRIADLAGTFNTKPLTIARNSTLIMGLAEDLIVDVKNASIELVYSGATYGWRIV